MTRWGHTGTPCCCCCSPGRSDGEQGTCRELFCSPCPPRAAWCSPPRCAARSSRRRGKAGHGAPRAGSWCPLTPRRCFRSPERSEAWTCASPFHPLHPASPQLHAGEPPGAPTPSWDPGEGPAAADRLLQQGAVSCERGSPRGCCVAELYPRSPPGTPPLPLGCPLSFCPRARPPGA